jgi:GNAT superfamily N-acetyltransferase
MALQFRLAQLGDARTVASLIALSSPDLVKYSFEVRGFSPQAFIEHDFRHDQGIFSCSLQSVAVDKNEVVANLTAYPGKDFRRLAFGTARSAFQFYGFRAATIVLARSLAASRLFKPPKEDGLFLANGYVVPAYRKPGAYSGLIERAKQMARDQGLRYLECDVSFWNERTLRIHEFLGFRVVEERPYHGKSKLLDGFRRMQLDLAAA